MSFKPGPNYALNDSFLRARLCGTIARRGVRLVVETGLNDGQSTVEFSRMAPKVIGVDWDPECINETARKMQAAGRENYELLCMSSPDAIRTIVANYFGGFPHTLFFLDAHWDGPSPVLREIREIPKGKGIIVFHDIKVPGKDFGYDKVELTDGTEVDLDYNFLQDELTAWSPTHRVEYMQQSDGCYRGAAIVYPS